MQVIHGVQLGGAMPGHALSRTPQLAPMPTSKDIRKEKLEVPTLLEALDPPTKTLRGFCGSFPPGWEGAEMGKAIWVSQGSSITP